MKKYLVLASLLLIAGCGSASIKSNSAMEDSKNYCTGTPEECVGQVAKINGKITKEIFQHISNKPAGYPYEHTIRINLGVMIGYSKEPIETAYAEDVEFIGKIIEVRSGGEGTKAGEEGVVEYQMLIDSWRVFDIMDTF